MNTIIELESTWTIDSFRQAEEKADDILEYNFLPYKKSCFKSLVVQQADSREDYLRSLGDIYQQPSTPEEWNELHQEQLFSVKDNLNDFSKARAIANLEWDEWYDFKVRNVLGGYLQVPPSMDPIPESVDDISRKKLNEAPTLLEAKQILNSVRQPEIPKPSATSGSSGSNGWFWKPRGDVIFSINGIEVEIPSWPENVKDDTSATWTQEMTTFQHYQPTNTYKGSGPRTVSCTFKLHRAMWDGNQDSGEFERLVAIMESACYPNYDTKLASPPLSTLTIGSSLSITGIMTTFSCTYQGPIGPDNKYDEGLITIVIVEVSDTVLSFNAVAGGLGGFR